MKQGITLILLSLLALPSLVFYRRPAGVKILNKIVYLQGWLGLIVCLWGIYNLLTKGFFNVNQSHSHHLFWIARFIVNNLQVLLGYLMGYSLISRYVYSGTNPARHKGNELLLKLVPTQGKIAIIGLIAGIAYIICIPIP